MEPVDDGDPLVRVTWHVPKSTLARLKEQSRLSGAPVAEVVRRVLLQEAPPVRSLDAVSPGDGSKVSTEVILPKVVEPGPWREGVVTATDVRPAVRVPTEDGAKLVDQGTGEVLATEKAKRPTRQTTAEELGMDPDAVAEKLEPDHVAMVGGRPWVPSKDQPKRPKVQHHDDVVIGGGALVKCRRCTLVKNAARPEVCDG